MYCLQGASQTDCAVLKVMALTQVGGASGGQVVKVDPLQSRPVWLLLEYRGTLLFYSVFSRLQLH